MKALWANWQMEDYARSNLRFSKETWHRKQESPCQGQGIGHCSAKVPSSSLDKITAEFLEQKLAELYPPPPPPAPPTPPPAPPPPPVAAPAPPAAIVIEPPKEVETAPPAVEIVQAPTAPAPVSAVPAPPVPALEIAASAAPAAPPAPPLPIAPVVPVEVAKPAAPPPPPPPPPVPKIGEKVGFVQLPIKPASRPSGERGAARGAAAAGRTDLTRRGDGRRAPGAPSAAGAGALPGQRTGARPASKSPAPAGAAGKAAEKFLPPATGQLITLKPPIIVRDLAEQLKRKPFQIIADLMEVGVFANVNQSIDEEVAQRICAKYNFRFEVEKRERGGRRRTPPCARSNWTWRTSRSR